GRLWRLWGALQLTRSELPANGESLRALYNAQRRLGVECSVMLAESRSRWALDSARLAGPRWWLRHLRARAPKLIQRKRVPRRLPNQTRSGRSARLSLSVGVFW